MRLLRDHAAFRGTVATFGAIVVVFAVLGVVAGLLWSHVAPRTAFVMTDTGPYPADPETQTLISADGWFSMIMGGLGLAAGLVAFVATRRQPVAGVLGLAGGGLLSSLLALRVGASASGTVQAAAPGGITTTSTLGLTATAALIVCPLLATGAFWVLEAASGRRPRPSPELEGPI